MTTAIALDPRGTVITRYNRIKNPSGRVSLTGFATYGGGVLTLGGGGGYVQNAVDGSYASSAVGILMATLTVGVDVLPNQDYVLSAHVTCQNARTFLVVIDAGVSTQTAVIFAPVAAPFSRISRGFKTAASGSMRVLMVAGDPTTSTSLMRVRDIQLEVGTALSPYFDGWKAAVPPFTYSWEGSANNSVSIERAPDPDTAGTATLVLGARLEWQVNSIVHDVAVTPSVTLRPAGPRSGRLRYLFSDQASARKAEIIHLRPGLVTLTDPDWPGSPMRYVAQGKVVSELDPETRVLWVVETDFVEV